jgi:hypothetical protein
MTLYITRNGKKRRIAAKWCQMWAVPEEVGAESPRNKDSSPAVAQAPVAGKEEAVTMGQECHLNRR